MTPPEDTASDPLAKDHNAYLNAALVWPHRSFKWLAIASVPMALLVLMIPRFSPKFELSVMFSSLFMFCMFVSGAWGRWKILRAWPKDHPWRAWAGPSFVMCLIVALLTAILPARFVILTVTAPFQWRADVILEYDARYDVAAELISLYGPEVERVIPELDGRTKKQVRLRLGETTPRSGNLNKYVISKSYGNKYTEKIDHLGGRDDYPSQAIVEWEGVYREAAGQCVFPLHKPIPEGYQRYLTEALGVQFGEFEGQQVVFGEGWISWKGGRHEGNRCYSTFDKYGSVAYAVFAALSYPYLYFRYDLYKVSYEARRYYDLSWDNLMDCWERII